MASDELARLLDDVEIRDLIRSYNRFLDDRRGDDLAALFAPDGVLHAMGNSTEGRDAIRSMFAQAGPPLERPVTAHHTTNTIIRIDGDLATGESDFLVVGRGEAGTTLMLAGRYRDRYVRSSEGWRIAERSAVGLARPRS